MSIVLLSKILQLQIQVPGKKYRGSRFDWTGQITQIVYKDKHTFCTNETETSKNKYLLGRGLYNEFGIDEAIGYEECKVGEQFPKIGIGMLTKEMNEDYIFFKNYEIEPADFNYKVGNDFVTFITESKLVNGYGFKLIKKIELNENSFSINYKLYNTGSKRINTNEYIHNFLAINHRKIDNSYKLEFSANLQQKGKIVNLENKVRFNQNCISWNSVVKNEFFFSKIQPCKEGNNSWLLENSIDKVGIKESGNFVPQQVNLWGSAHVVSPEIYYEVIVEPGKSISWQRNYEIYEF